MPKPIAIACGTRMGWMMHAGWPLARLFATSEQLAISAPLLGKYAFAPDNVVAVEIDSQESRKYVRILHTRLDCPRSILLWHWRGPSYIVRAVESAGFFPAEPASQIPPPRGIAIRWSVIVGFLLTWNALCIPWAWNFQRAPNKPSRLILAALLLAFCLSAGTLASSRLQRVVLKPGRDPGEVRPFVRLLAFVSGLSLIFFSAWALLA